MINPATQKTPDWNSFTEFVRDNPGVMVKIRNGYFVQPIFHKAEDEFCSDGFSDNNHHWKTNGRSITSKDFDMMSLEATK